MKFEITILGSNSAFPAQGRYPSAQVVNHNETLFLVDCGEGTQIRMSDFGIKRTRISQIFISHLHGDHIYGLPGLINSYQHLSRTLPLHLYGPVGLRQMIETVLRLSQSMLDFEIVFHELQSTEKQKLLETKDLRVYAFPLTHRVPTYGYLFQEKHTTINVRKDAIAQYHLSVAQIKQIKSGLPVQTPSGEAIPEAAVIEPPRPPRSFAYCSDTRYDERIVPWIDHVTLLYHEATFLHALEHKARESMHSTALEAGMMAHHANAGKLLIGHFSSRYDDLTALLNEASEIFQNTDLALEGQTYQVTGADAE